MAAAVLDAKPVVASPAAEPDAEIFDVYSEDGQLVGQELRAVCHRDGLWHRAVYVLLFNPRGELLIQKRVHEKKVAPGQWDLSAAEHMCPGEEYADGAIRGLAEELGVHLTAEQRAQLQGPLTPRHQRRLFVPERGIQDFEFIEIYRLDNYVGPIRFNQQEVSECRWVSLQQLREDMAARPDDFTVWFREEMQALDLMRA